MDLEQMAREAAARVQRWVARSAAQHKRAIRNEAARLRPVARERMRIGADHTLMIGVSAKRGRK